MGEHRRIEIIDNWLTEDCCNVITNSLKNVNSSYWIDRHKNIPNYGIHGDVGKYSSISSFLYPTLDIIQDINKHAPVVSGVAGEYEIQETIINHYSPGHFVPPHCDTVRDVFAIAMVMLGNVDSCFHYYPNGADKERVTISDKKGRAVILHDVGLIHEVTPVTVERYTLIYNYY